MFMFVLCFHNHHKYSHLAIQGFAILVSDKLAMEKVLLHLVLRYRLAKQGSCYHFQNYDEINRF